MQSAVEREDPIEAPGLLATGTDGASLREVVAQRVAAHRSRRVGAEALEAARQAALRQERDLLARENRRGVSKVRDTVRARYENSQSYREFLAAEAERALQQAQAEAEVASRNARAIAEAQMQLLEEMQQWPEPEPSPRQQAIAEFRSEARSELAHELADIALGARELISESPALSIVEAPAPREPETWPSNQDLFDAPAPASPSRPSEISASGLTVRLYEDLGPARQLPPFKENDRRRASSYAGALNADEELEELDQEIAFRRAPEFIDHVLEALPLPANLIEFPRQLIAPRKARPRLAEGPLRDEVATEPQLRIFEVEPEQISLEPAVLEEVDAADGPDWQGLLLDTTPQFSGQFSSQFRAQPPAHYASHYAAQHAAQYADQYGSHYGNADASHDPAQYPANPDQYPAQYAQYAAQYPDQYPDQYPEDLASGAAATLPGIAPIHRRLMALAVDGCCVGAAFVAFATVVSYISGPGLQSLPKPTLAAAAAIVLAVSFLIYEALFFTFADATPGMRYARIALCTFAEEVPTRKSMRRRILATTLAACPLGLGLLWVWMDDDRLGWHDRISRMYHRSY